MPSYDYKCSKCEHTFESQLKMADRKQPEENPCPECGEIGVEQLIGAPLIADPARIGVRKPTSEFREAMRKVKKKHPLANVKDYG